MNAAGGAWVVVVQWTANTEPGFVEDVKTEFEIQVSGFTGR